MLEWMAQERIKLEAAMPPEADKLTVSLKDLTEGEFKSLSEGEIFMEDGEPFRLSGSSMDMYRTLRRNLPRLPVYTIPSLQMLSEVEREQDVTMEGMASEVSVHTKKFSPPSGNKLMLLWNMIGVVKGVRQPIMGFIREDREQGMLYTVEPKTLSFREHVQALMAAGLDADKEAHVGLNLADLLVRTANKSIIPRGACNDRNIGVRDDGQMFFRVTVFQAVNTPQESMNFMLKNMSPSSLSFMAGETPPSAQELFLTRKGIPFDPLKVEHSVFTEGMQKAFLRQIDDAGLLDTTLFEEMKANNPGYYARIPRVFREYAEKRMRGDLPPPK